MDFHCQMLRLTGSRTTITSTCYDSLLLDKLIYICFYSNSCLFKLLLLIKINEARAFESELLILEKTLVCLEALLA